MKIFNNYTKADTYIEVSNDEEKMVLPISSVILVDDESGFVSIKTTGSRKTIGLITQEAYGKDPNEPEHYKLFGYLSNGDFYVIPENGNPTLTTNDTRPYANDMVSAKVGTGVTNIDFRTFYNCSSLTSVTIPDSVTSIGGSAFYGCSGLTSVSIGNGVTSIGSYAFSGCIGLTAIYVNSLKSWTNIDGAPTREFFLDANAKLYIKGIPVEGELVFPNDVVTVRNFTFYKYITSVTIPDSVTSIGGMAFYGCSGLTSVSIGNGVTSIGDMAFCACENLISVTIGNSVANIGAQVFRQIPLTNITLPISISIIGDLAFWNTDLNYAVCLAAIPPTLGNDTFTNQVPIYSKYPIYVPDASVDAYKAASGWSKYADKIKPLSEFVE